MRIFRNSIFWLHLTGGCVAGIVILTMAVTGALLGFQRQITNLIDTPAILQSQPTQAQPAQIDAILSSLQKSGLETPTELVIHNSPKAPVEARFGREHTFFINPWTGEIIGQPSESLRQFFGNVEMIHRSLGLGMRNAIGRGITGAANFVFLFMVISGMYLWLPRILSRSSFKSRLFFRFGLQGRTREWNWHHVVGVWTAPPLFFIVLTGVIMSYPWASNLLFTLTGSQPPAAGERGGPPRGGEENHTGRGAFTNHRSEADDARSSAYRTIDSLLVAAEQQTSSWKTITVSVPRPQDHTLNLTIDKGVGGQPEKAFQLVIDRQNGNTVANRQFSDNSTGRKLRAWARFLHTGEELGLAGQIIAALACLGAVVLVWTGISMALRRAFARFELAREESQPAEEEEQAISA